MIQIAKNSITFLQSLLSRIFTNSRKAPIIVKEKTNHRERKDVIENRQTKSSGLAERLRAELLAGQYPSGSPVASVRELAKRYGISTVTADKILRQLVKEDFLYRVPQSGTFIKHDPPPVPVIGYAGCLPDPADKWSSILQTAYRHLQDYLAEQKVEQHIIPYHELRHGAQAEKRLKHLNGLLLSASFIDDVTLPIIRKFKGRIVLMDNVSIINQFPCSQVIPDYTPALREFVERYDLSRYRKILILRAGHYNAIASELCLREIFPALGIPADKLETMNLKGINNLSAQTAAIRYFSRETENLRDLLLVSLSDYFARGIREIFRGREDRMPDILSFDNLEAYNDPSDETPFLTTVDPRLPDCYAEAIRLLIRLITENDERNYIIQLPARLVVRKSIKQSGSTKPGKEPT